MRARPARFARKLYMSVGMPTRHMVGDADDAQNPANHAGKILRLNDDGTAPDLGNRERSNGWRRDQHHRVGPEYPRRQ